MFNQNITVTPLPDRAAASYRIEQPGQLTLIFDANRDGAQVLGALAEAFRQGEAWLGCHKASNGHIVSSVEFDDPRYYQIQHWEKSDRITKTAWNELVIDVTVVQQRHRMVFCVADDDLVLDLWGALGETIEVSAV